MEDWTLINWLLIVRKICVKALKLKIEYRRGIPMTIQVKIKVLQRLTKVGRIYYKQVQLGTLIREANLLISPVRELAL